jgi:Flp pilus assembly protein TadG
MLAVEPRKLVKKRSHFGRRLRHRGQSLVEALTGLIIIIPLALFAFDVAVMAASSQNTNHLAAEAARAAGDQLNSGDALQAAQAALKGSTSNNVTIKNFNYNEQAGTIHLTVNLQVNLPVPFGPLSQVNFSAQAVEPIVAQPAPN